MAPVSLIVHLAGPDRPGLVEALSTAISESGANWEGSRMARLSGHFAGVVQVVVPEANAGDLKNALQKLSGDDLLVSIVDNVSVDAQAGPAGVPASIEVVGQDRKGIVKEISQKLAGLNVNVSELVTECLSAPMSGERIFEAYAEITMPEGVTPETVRESLEGIASDLAVTITDVEEL